MNMENSNFLLTIIHLLFTNGPADVVYFTFRVVVDISHRPFSRDRRRASVLRSRLRLKWGSDMFLVVRSNMNKCLRIYNFGVEI